MHCVAVLTRVHPQRSSNGRVETLLLLAALALNLPETAPFQALVPWSPPQFQLGARCLAPTRTVLCQDAHHKNVVYLHPIAARARVPDPLALRAAGDAGGDVEYGEVESNVQLDVLVEDLSLSEDQVERVRQDAESLLRGALNPDGDPSWDEEVELSVVLASDAHIRALNREWRGKDAATDVLSFPQGDDAGGLLGDLVVSIETASRQADERGHSLQTELRVLMVHGLLHLLGYDHETAESDAEEMRDAETRLLDRLGWGGQGLIAFAADAPDDC
ncbi:hypothetical protein T484DRAFT_1942443 [Baffinella frigidus]|nr:hypothetical protein T484DRAFT_1942443 [Cryptophyta sp. CCMP2293]